MKSSHCEDITPFELSPSDTAPQSNTSWPLKELKDHLTKIFRLGEWDINNSPLPSNTENDIVASFELDVLSPFTGLAEGKLTQNSMANDHNVSNTTLFPSQPGVTMHYTAGCQENMQDDYTPPAIIKMDRWWFDKPEYEDPSIEWDYLPDNSPLKGKEKATWHRKRTEPYPVPAPKLLHSDGRRKPGYVDRRKEQRWSRYRRNARLSREGILFRLHTAGREGADRRGNILFQVPVHNSF